MIRDEASQYDGESVYSTNIPGTTLSFYWDTLLDGAKTSFWRFFILFPLFLSSSSFFDDFSLVGSG